MTRSPLAYPLNRTADTDVGGAADLQTDIMRFMAILSLCLVAIFALVQSIPMAPTEPVLPIENSLPATTTKDPVGGGLPATATKDPVGGGLSATPTKDPVGGGLPATATKDPVGGGLPATATKDPVGGGLPATATKDPVGGGLPATESTPEQEPERAVVLTRPKWIPKYKPQVAAKAPPTESPRPEPIAAEAAPTEAPPASEPEPEQDGFTLRFASDAALTRAVAAQFVGLYALEPGSAKRMTVSESRISFWDASTPNTFHEMESTTVPGAVVDALARTGVTTENVSWGVTLPGRMKTQLDALMQEHRGGSLIINASGDIHWEAT